MKNLDLRLLIEKERVKGYEIAEEMGIAETSFSRLLARKELSNEQKEKIMQAIKRIKECEKNEQ